MTNPKCVQKPPSVRNGFTLIEVIISIALGSILILIAYASLDIATKLTTAGTEGAKVNGLARAVFQEIELSLRSQSNNRLDYVHHYAPSFEAEDSTFNTNLIPRSSVLGTEDLLLVKRCTEADPKYDHQSRLNGYHSTIEFDVFFVTSSMNDQRLTKALNRLGFKLGRTPNSIRKNAGLHRYRVSLNWADRKAVIKSINWAFEKIEFKSMAFEYFDGQEWQDTWEYTENSPVAVRVSTEMNKNASNMDDVDQSGSDRLQYATTVKLPSAQIMVVEK